jgi:hypothetical protein
MFHFTLLKTNPFFRYVFPVFLSQLRTTLKYPQLNKITKYLIALFLIIYKKIYKKRIAYFVYFFKYKYYSIKSNGLTIFFIDLSVTWVYMSVVFISLCPKSSCIKRISVPFSSKCVAKLWRKLCILKLL